MDVSHGYGVRPNPNPPPPTTSYNMFKANKPAAAKSKAASWFNRDLKRKKRIAKYKWYDVEGKAKNSIKKGFRWFKHKWRKIVDGF